jgi:hypothetical protein
MEESLWHVSRLTETVKVMLKLLVRRSVVWEWVAGSLCDLA